MRTGLTISFEGLSLRERLAEFGDAGVAAVIAFLGPPAIEELAPR